MAKGLSPLLTRQLKKVREEGKSVVFANGCFDVLHLGHIHLLRKAKEEGDFLVVGLNSDRSVKRLKGVTRPIFTERERKVLLGAIKYVDAVVVFDDLTPLNIVKKIRPNVIVKGGDYGSTVVVGQEFVESYGGKVVLVKYLTGHSTSKVISQVYKQYSGRC